MTSSSTCGRFFTATLEKNAGMTFTGAYEVVVTYSVLASQRLTFTAESAGVQYELTRVKAINGTTSLSNAISTSSAALLNVGTSYQYLLEFVDAFGNVASLSNSFKVEVGFSSLRVNDGFEYTTQYDNVLQAMRLTVKFLTSGTFTPTYSFENTPVVLDTASVEGGPSLFIVRPEKCF